MCYIKRRAAVFVKLRSLLVLVVVSLFFVACEFDTENIDSAIEESPLEGYSAEKTDRTYFVTSTELNIRAGAGVTYDIVYIAYDGEALKMTGNEEIASDTTWYEVITANGKGWCNGKYGTVIKEGTLSEEIIKRESEEAIKNALSGLKMSEDRVERVKSYIPSTFPEYKNERTYVLPFLLESEGKYYLMIRYNYYGAFLGWDRIVFAIDDDRYEKSWDYFDIEREFDDNILSCENVTEIEPTQEDIVIMRKIADSNETIIRFYADNGEYYDHSVNDSDKKEYKKIMDAYDIIGNVH